MLEGLFGNAVIERILFSLHVYGETYPYSLATTFGQPVNRFQQQLKRLWNAGIVASRRVGRTRTYAVNPRYPFRAKLVALVGRAFEFVPEEEREAFYRRRTRPRRAGKPA